MSRVNGGSTFGASATGWTVEIVHPSGYVHTPAVMDEPSPQRNPIANGMPTITIPVHRDEKWSHPAFEDADLRVWHNGERQPVDRVEEIEQTERATVIKGRGGLQMERRAQAEVTQQRATTFAEGLIESTTDYQAHVDRPQTTRENGILLDSVTRDGHFATRLDTDSTDPLRIGDGAVKLAQSCYPKDAADATALGTRSGPQYNDGEISVVSSERPGGGDEAARFQFTTEYDIPAAAVGIKIRDEVFSYSELDVFWDGALIGKLRRGNNPLTWREIGAYSGRSEDLTYQAAVGVPIRAGETHQLTFERPRGSPCEHGFDVVALYDRRFDYSWPNPGAGNNGNCLAGPQLYPKAYDARFDAPVPSRAVVGGRLDVSGKGDGSGVERLLLSNTQGEDYGGVSNTDTYVEEFETPGPSLLPLVTLARYGDKPDRNQIPTTGFRSQWLRSYQLHVDLEDIPLVVNRTFDDDLVNVLADVADGANAVFEYRREGPHESIEWTQPGQRTANVAPDASSFSVTKSTANRIEKAVVYGATRDIDGEVLVILDGEAGKNVDLAHDRIQQGTVTVEAYLTGKTMDEGPDYTVRYQDGVIDTKRGGRMDDNTEYRVSYSYQTYGEYTAPGIESPRETVEETTVPSDFAAKQTARMIVNELREPLERGQLTIGGDAAGYSVVEVLSADNLPGGLGSPSSQVQIQEITSRPGSADLRLGSRRSVNEIIADIERNITAVTRRV